MTLNQVICWRKTTSVLNSFLSVKLTFEFASSIFHFHFSIVPVPDDSNEWKWKQPACSQDTFSELFKSFQQFSFARTSKTGLFDTPWRHISQHYIFIQYFFRYQINYISLLCILISILHSSTRIVFQLFVPYLRRNFPRRQIKCFKEVL